MKIRKQTIYYTSSSLKNNILKNLYKHSLYKHIYKQYLQKTMRIPVSIWKITCEKTWTLKNFPGVCKSAGVLWLKKPWENYIGFLFYPSKSNHKLLKHHALEKIKWGVQFEHITYIIRVSIDATWCNYFKSWRILKVKVKSVNRIK